MHERLVSRNTAPSYSQHLLMTAASLIRQKVLFWTTNGMKRSMADPRRAPSTLRKKVRKNETNDRMHCRDTRAG